MQNSKLFAAIDIGTTKVFTVIGKKAGDGRVEILGHGLAPCSGVHKGVVEDVAATQSAVRSSVSMAERSSGATVDTAFVGISGTGISYEKRVDTIDWVGEHGVITARDVEQVPQSIVRNGVNGSHRGRKTIHAIPQSYSIDGKIGVHDPMGMHTRKIDVETHLVEGSEAEIGKLKKAVEGIGIKVESLVLEALASSESVLTEEDKVRGAAMIDIGGGTTDVMVFKDGAMNYSTVIPIGGFQFTNDICVVYNTPYEAAEAAKLAHASVRADSVRIHEQITLPITSGNTLTKVSLHELCQLTRERANELMRLIVLKLREGGVIDLNGYRVVLTGGASRLSGFMELFQLGTSANVRMGAPFGYLGVPMELQAPAYSTGAGMLIWAAHQEDDEPKPHAIGQSEERQSQHKKSTEKVRKGGILSLFRR